MQKNDKQYGTPFVDYTAAKSQIEALPNMRLGAHAAGASYNLGAFFPILG